MTSDISKTITALRFPICIAVAFIHSTVGNVKMADMSVTANMGGYNMIHDYISYGICASAVPLFFFISGYLYFQMSPNKSFLKIYVEKSKKRLYSLVIPYIIWNTLLLALFFIVQTLLPNMMSGAHKLILDYNILDFLLAYWDAGEGFPINGPMWFIRNLIIYSFLFPMVYVAMKEKWVGLIVTIAMLAMGLKISYFVAGAWCAMHSFNFVRMSYKLWLYTLLLWLVLIAACLNHEGIIYTLIKCLYVLLGMISLTGIVALIYKNRKIGKTMAFLSSTSFFVFALHQAPLLMLCKLWSRIFPANDTYLIIGYLVLPLFMVAICVAIFYAMKQICPKVLSVMNGGRV